MMRTPAFLRPCLPVIVLACVALGLPTLQAQNSSSAQAKILLPADLGRIMPGAVFFRGQTASVQLRNTYGVRFPGGALLMAGLVDSSGYSSSIQQKYQGYILSEVTLNMDGKKLLPGAYGFGMRADGSFVVMDLGAHDILQVSAHMDKTMSRPRPLAILPGQHPGSYRLYEGKKFVSIDIVR